MKKLVLSLLGAATLATASNAMALNTNNIYVVALTTGGFQGQTAAGAAVFDFDSEFFNVGSMPGVPNLFPGSCVYSMQWLDENPAAFVTPSLGGPMPTGILPLSAQGWLAEQMTHGNGSCLENSMMQVPSLLSAAPTPFYPDSVGFTPFGQISTIQTLQLGEQLFPTPALAGVIQFASVMANHTIYGVSFR